MNINFIFIYITNLFTFPGLSFNFLFCYDIRRPRSTIFRLGTLAQKSTILKKREKIGIFEIGVKYNYI